MGHLKIYPQQSLDLTPHAPAFGPWWREIPPPTEYTHRCVYDLISTHIGPQDAITGIKMARALDQSWGKVRESIRTIRRENKIPILSGPNGYYMPETKADFDDAINQMRAQGLGTLKTAAALRGMSIRQMFEDGLREEMKGQA